MGTEGGGGGGHGTTMAVMQRIEAPGKHNRAGWQWHIETGMIPTAQPENDMLHSALEEVVDGVLSGCARRGSGGGGSGGGIRM